MHLATGRPPNQLLVVKEYGNLQGEDIDHGSALYGVREITAPYMDPISELLTSYADLNASYVAELETEPSPLQFMRFVALNTPFVVKNATTGWRATKLWSSSYFRSALKGQIVNVAVTPLGNADSPISFGDGTLRFVKPLEEDQLFEEFLDYTINQELNYASGDVRYAQTRQHALLWLEQHVTDYLVLENDNLREEYASLAGDVEKDIYWARIALQMVPEAVNLWLGNSRSVSALHQDNYENIYCQILGKKHFVLLPPLSSPCVGEQDLKPASYVRQDCALEILEEEGDAVRFPTWDPDSPNERATRYSQLAKPIRITLEPGDILYLPALWYHKVSQSCSSEGLCCAINYWYDMFSYSGSFMPCTEFVRNVARVPV